MASGTGASAEAERTREEDGVSELGRHRGRNIVVDRVRWVYRVTRGSVVAYSESGERRCSPAWEVRGLSPGAFERGQWKRTADGKVCPSDIARWLRRTA